ncbi:MAG: hypothetical protein M1828_007431 [Chrysothrix sp. TS-e1954]|nr:MAG: hypothetical protein M1828_007431 [Chrysothrix sp. TS-e1954]
MITGVEAAGLLLASFPLVISALEHYREGLEPLKDFWKFRAEFLTLVHQIGYESIRFEENIEELLSPIVYSEDELEALCQEPGGPAWQDPDLETRLKARLPRSFEWYCGIVAEMNQAMTRLKGKLHISDDAQSQWLQYEKGSGVFKSMKWDFELNRLRIVLSKKKRERLLDTINKHNTALQTLLGSSERLAPLRRERKGKAASALARIRDQAASLYRVFCSCWPCMCPAHNHTTHLLLEPRPGDNAARGNEEEKYAIQLASTFSVAEQNNWRIACVEVRTLHAEVDWTPLRLQASKRAPEMLHAVKMDFQMHNSVHTSSAIKANSMKKKAVAFQAHTDSSFHTRTDSPFQARTDLPDTSVLRTEKILDLCATLGESQSSDRPIGHLPDDQLKHLIFVSTPPKEIAKQSTTLAQMLKTGIARRQRIVLSITLASSLLQLYQTQWLSSSWGKEEVLFLRDERDPAQFDVSKPFLARQTYAYPANPEVLECDGRQALLHLGIVLLELCFGQSLEEQSFWKDFLGPDGKPNRFTNRCAATNWQESVLGEGGELFSTAIGRCIDCAFETSSTILADSELRQAVHDNVVEQLQSVLKAHDGAIT